MSPPGNQSSPEIGETRPSPGVDFRLPIARMLVSALAAGGLVFVAGAIVVVALRPGGFPGLAGGVGAGAAGPAVALLLIGPWKTRPLLRWGMLLFAAQGISVVGAAALALLLYSATRPDPLVLVPALAATFVAVWATLARVFGAHVQALRAGAASR